MFGPEVLELTLVFHKHGTNLQGNLIVTVCMTLPQFRAYFRNHNARRETPYKIHDGTCMCTIILYIAQLKYSMGDVDTENDCFSIN